ncbi:MAG TPA: glycoside hydrolase family 25 protein [Mycobacteriales bacterium]
MSLRPIAGAALVALAAATVVTALPGPARASSGRPSAAPSAGPRTPGDPGAQLTTGMMPPGSPDAAGDAVPSGHPAPRDSTNYLNGVDVASYQHPNGAAITWSQVAASGQSFVVVKATESTTYTNPYEAGDVAGARQAGLRVGLYHFARPSLVGGSPTADAQAEADYFSTQVNAVTGAQLPPTLDLEVNGGLSVSQLVAWTSAFLTRVQTDTGRRPMIYTGPNFWNSSMGGSTAFTIYPLWEAHYTTAASPQSFGGWSTWTLWQWSDGSYASPPAVPGISGAVDRDRFAGSLSDLEGVESASDGVAAPFTGTASPSSIPDGSLVQLAGTTEVYVVAGTAPVYLDSWADYPGTPVVRELSAAQFYSLRSSPRDGTFLRAAPTGQVYEVVGQAPVYVTSWQPWGRVQPYVNVGQGTVDNAGQPGVYAHLAAVPQDGTFVNALETGSVYRIAGGAPIYVSSWSYFGGPQPVVSINEASIDAAPSGPATASGPLQHLYQQPVDGTFLSDPTAGTFFTTQGGALVAVDDDGQAFTAIGDSAVQNAGQPGVWSHLAASQTN